MLLLVRKHQYFYLNPVILRWLDRKLVSYFNTKLSFMINIHLQPKPQHFASPNQVVVLPGPNQNEGSVHLLQVSCFSELLSEYVLFDVGRLETKCEL